MSRMKHLLRKLHIGGGGGPDFADHHRVAITDARPSENISPRRPTTQQSVAFPSSSTQSSSSLSPLTDSTGGESLVDKSVDFNFFEEEFQMQLALAISVSDPEAREDADTVQIKAAKQKSLGYPPYDSVVEFLSVRYWSNNVVNYDEKVMNG